MSDRCRKNVAKFRQLREGTASGSGSCKTTTNAKFVLICPQNYRDDWAYFMQLYQALVESDYRPKMNDMPRWIEFLHRQNAFYNEAVILGRFGSAVKNLIIEADIRHSLPSLSQNLAELLEPFLRLCKLLCALECWCDALCYCDYALFRDKSRLEFEVIKSVCVAKLYPYKPNIKRDKLPHVETAEWVERMRQADLLLLYDNLVYEKRILALVEIENQIESAKVDLCRKRFEETHLSRLEIVTPKTPSSSVKSNVKDDKKKSEEPAPKINSSAIGKIVEKEENLLPANKNPSVVPKKMDEVPLSTMSETNNNKSSKKKKSKSKPKNKKSKNTAAKKQLVELKMATSNASESDSVTSESVSLPMSRVSSSCVDQDQNGYDGASAFSNDLIDDDVGSSDDFISTSSTATTTTTSVESIYSLDALWKNLKEMFHFELACDDCIMIQIRINDRYVVTRRSGGHDSCRRNIVLARAVNEKGNALVKIRRPVIQPSSSSTPDFCVCSKIKNNEDCLDDACRQAHSPEEQTIWNCIQDASSKFFNVFDFIKINCEKLYGVTKTEANKKVKQRDKTPEKKATSAPKNDSVASSAQKVTLSSSFQSNSVIPKNVVVPHERLKTVKSLNEAPNLLELIPLMNTHDLFPGCRICVDENVFTSHVCTRDVVLCREKTNSWAPWHKLRPKPKDLRTNVTYFTNCRDFPSCPRAGRCTFAHSRMEQTLWTREVREKIILVPSTEQTIILSNAIIPTDGAKRRKVVDVGEIALRLACNKCSIMIIPPNFVLYYFRHECEENLVMAVGDDDDDERKMSAFWLNIRRKPAACLSGNFQICSYLTNEGLCPYSQACQYAHSLLEWRFWRLEFDKKFNINDFVAEEKQSLRETPILKRDKIDVAGRLPVLQTVPKVTFAAEPSTSNIVTPANGFNTINNSTPFAFRVHYICGRCFTSGGRRIVYQSSDGTHCEHPEKHLWRIHKTLVMIDKNGVVEKLRPVPDFLRKKYAARPVNVTMCTLSSNCDRSICTFAHSLNERSCWMLLLRTGKNVDDIVQEKPASASKPITSAVASNSNVSGALPKSCTWATQKVETSRGASMLMLENQRQTYYCYLCDKEYKSHSQYESHCETETHKNRLTVDQTRIWKCRAPRVPPPFKLCSSSNECQLAESFCTFAHSQDELDEWQERLNFIRAELERTDNVELEKILKRIGEAKARSDVIVDALDFADVDLFCCLSEVKYSADKKGVPYRWTFSVATDKPLLRVALLDKRYFYYFRLMTPNKNTVVSSGGDFLDLDMQNYYEVRLEFVGSNSLGTFTQEILFDFGVRQYVSKKVTIHVGLSEVHFERMTRLEKLITSENCWNVDNCEIMWISKDRSQQTMNRDLVSHLCYELNDSSYFPVMEEWILAEEMRRQSILSSFRLSSTANLMPCLYGDSGQIIRPHRSGCIFAELLLDNPISEDYDIYDLLLGYCQYAFVALPENAVPPQQQTSKKRRVYEVDVVGRQNFGFDGLDQQHVYLCLSEIFVKHFNLHSSNFIPRLEVQFNIHHKSFATWLSSLHILRKKELSHVLFPDLLKLFRPYLLGQVSEEAVRLCPKLTVLEDEWKRSDKNDEQCIVLRHVVYCALNKTGNFIPPMVIFGPFGTGKTRTMAEAVSVLLTNAEFAHTKILICTHSNTTADIYLTLLEKFTCYSSDKLKDMLFRVFAKKTKADNLPPKIKPYVRVSWNGYDWELEQFSIQTFVSVRVVVCTLSMAGQLVKFLEQDPSCRVKFSHIFLDEAAQSIEVETLMPLCMASKKTCVVVAGDHHQIKPTIYLNEAEELSCSYLERLYYYYNKQATTFQETAKLYCSIPKVLFNKNYRCHPEILSFVSAEFYGSDASLVSCFDAPTTFLRPMYFAAAVGEEEILDGGVSLSNAVEVEEIFAQIRYFYANWPVEWGEIDSNSIGIIVPYFDQLKLVQERIKQNRQYVGKVHAGKVIGMQGKEFKVLLISTVRGRNLLTRDNLHIRKLGFLDDSRLINTALTRAKYSVVVVGDPVLLCSVGACKNTWKRYIKNCFDKKTFLPEHFTLETLENQVNDLQTGFPSSILKEKCETQLDADLIIRQLIDKTKSESSTNNDVIGVVENSVDVVWPETKNEPDIESYFVDSLEKFRRSADMNDAEKSADMEFLSQIEPETYKTCILHIVSSKQIYASPVNRREEIIHVRGRRHCLEAFHEDKVVVKITDQVAASTVNHTERKTYGKVIGVVERRFNPVGKNFVCCADPYTVGILTPLDPRLPRICTIGRKRSGGGKCLVQYDVDERSKITFVQEHEINLSNCDEKLFVVLFLKWSEGYWCPLGVIIDFIRTEKTLECGLRVLGINYGIERLQQSSSAAYQEAVDVERKFSTTKSKTKEIQRLPPEFRKNRVDLTKLMCFTIDPPEATDLDDALSIENGPDGNTYEVGVHIADVSAFVEKNSHVDLEAYERGETFYSSVQSDGKTAYMINKRLSTNFLSLLPDRERAALSLFVVVDRNGNIDENRTTFRRSVIVSKHRLTYQRAEEIINSSNADDFELNAPLIILYKLAKKLKERRVGLAESLTIEFDEGRQYFKAHLLISEWMVTANKTVAEKISAAFPGMCPLRRQLSPPAQQLAQWVEKFTCSAKNSLSYRRIVPLSNDVYESLLFPDVKILRSTFESIVRAQMDGDEETISKFVCTEKVHPSIVPLTVEMQQMQERAFYQPSAVAGDDTKHYGLNVNVYTQFTSPIRRYIDLVCHRLLIASLNNAPCPYDIDELIDICTHCTEKYWRATDYEREAHNLKLASEIYKKPKEVTAIIYKIGDVELNLEYPTLDKRVSNLKTLRYNHLQLSKNPELEAATGSVRLFWKKEIYVYEKLSTSSTVVLNEPLLLESDANVIALRGAYWFRLLESLTKRNSYEMNVAIDDIKRYAKIKDAVDVSSEQFTNKLLTMQKQSAQYAVCFMPSTALQVQLSVEIRRGFLTPCIQLLRLTPTINVCFEHVRDTAICFNDTRRKPTKSKYKNVADYQQIWLPLLQIESSDSSVKSGDAVRIHNVEAFWFKNKNERVCVTLEMLASFCERREIKFSRTDCGGEVGLRLQNMLKLDYFCIEVPVRLNDGRVDYIWVAHCASTKVSIVKERNSEKKKFPDDMWSIDCILTYSSTEIPESIMGKTIRCSVEFLKTPDPHHRMQNALLQLQHSNEILTDIVLGRHQFKFSAFGYQQDARQMRELIVGIESHLPCPNADQSNAIIHSLTNSFSLIWGPPGTGKTVTAVRLACCIAKLNKNMVHKYGSRIPKLLYCAPSNKAVNVVGRIFVYKIKEENLRVVRMYGREIERSEFPLPTKEPIRRGAGQDMDRQIESIALHHLIRSDSNTFGRQLRELDAKFRDIRRLLQENRTKEITDNLYSLVKRYKTLVNHAEEEEIAKCDIILCTCSAASRQRLHFLETGVYIVPQVIIDEASMCNEPESLIPIMSTACEQLTLVGDHKQLGPVVLSREAREFGFDSSLFDKYSPKAVMLTNHYRMQKEIAQFPSQCFYEDRLKTATNAQNEISRLPIWPNDGVPLAFCHCVGVESQCIVTTEDSSEMSASNLLEAQHAVRIVLGLIENYGVNLEKEKIAILSQYRAQINLVSSLLPDQYRDKISVLTVIRSQGDEWDYVVFSTVRSCSEAEIELGPSVSWIRQHLGSVTDERQVTVAITRSKKGLIILGNRLLLSVDETWKKLVENYIRRRLIVAAEDFLR